MIFLIPFTVLPIFLHSSIHSSTLARILFASVLYLFIVLDVFVRHAGQQLSEILALVVLPALPVGLQVSVEALHPVLALLHICGHLHEDTQITQPSSLQQISAWLILQKPLVTNHLPSCSKYSPYFTSILLRCKYYPSVKQLSKVVMFLYTQISNIHIHSRVNILHHVDYLLIPITANQVEFYFLPTIHTQWISCSDAIYFNCSNIIYSIELVLFLLLTVSYIMIFFFLNDTYCCPLFLTECYSL